MIKPNDVRVGNWLKCNDLFIDVSGISKTSFTCTDRGLMYFNMEDVQPIEITVDILQKLGFEYNDDLGYCSDEIERKVYSKNGFHVSEREGKFCYWFDNDGDTYYSFEWMDLNFVHQLQNVHYVIRDSELEVVW